MGDRTRVAFCWVVSLGWLANLAAGMVPALDYQPNLVTNAPMMLVLGAVFASGRKRDHDDAR